MDWQVVILTLGTALITGVTSIVVNILVVRSGLRKSVLENKEQKEKEFMTTRINAYASILVILRDLNEGIGGSELIDKHKQLEEKWLANYPYLSINVNRLLLILTDNMEAKDSKNLTGNIRVIREKIKEELDEYYNIIDKDDWDYKPKHFRRKSKYR